MLTNIGVFQNVLNDLSRKLLAIDDEEYEIVYRGFEDATWDDTPYLFRNPNFLKKEKDFVEEVIRNFPDEFSSAHTIDILTQLQHYECPTRMLDVTSNFLVALFFACGGWRKDKKSDAKNAAVKIYKVKKNDVKSIDSETVTTIANIARMKDGDAFGMLPWICEKDWGMWQSDDDQFVQNAKDVNSVILVKTRLNNPRVRAQFGEFFLFGGLNGIEGINCASCLRNINVRKKIIPMPKEYIVSDILIPKQDHETILKLLDKCFKISLTTLCPEKQDFIKNLI
jgi:hypothetical protein